MSVADIPLGRYLHRPSPLHRLDARTKLLALPATVVAAFALHGWAPLGVLGLWTALLLGASGVAVGAHLRGLRALRWLLLFTLLVHLLLSPGRTLWGLPWLSLDGLLQGAHVAAQLVLAVLLSSLLTLTTAPAALAGALEWLLTPLHLMTRLPRSGGMLVWVLHFVPILREEAGLALAETRAAEGAPRGVLGRAQQARAALGPLIARLVRRADDLAHQLAAGEDPLRDDGTAPGRPGWRDALALALTLSVIALAAGVR